MKKSNIFTLSVINALPSQAYALCRAILVLLAMVALNNYNAFASGTTDPCLISCQLRTQTQGGWGQSPSGNNPGSYLAANFGNAFPDGVTIGNAHCGDNTSFTFTSAEQIRAFLPAGGTPATLKDNSSSVFAGQVLALSLSVGFDTYDPHFGPSDYSLKDAVLTSGLFKGYTVAEVLAEANRALSGCSPTNGYPSYTLSQLSDVVASINESNVDGTRNTGLLMCRIPRPVPSVRNVAVCEHGTTNAASVELATLLVNSGGGRVSYHLTEQDANANTNPISSPYTFPVGSTNVWIRSENMQYPDCYNIRMATVTVNPNPRPTVPDRAVCVGSNVTFTASPNNTTLYSYQWYRNDVEITGATNPTYQVTNATMAMNNYVYRVRITNKQTHCVGYGEGKLTVNPNPAPTVADRAVCVGGNVTFTAEPNNTTLYSYQWYRNGVAITDATNPTYQVVNATSEMNNDVYKVRVTNIETHCYGYGEGRLRVNPNPAPTVNSPMVCAGRPATFMASPADVGTYSYQWYLGEHPIVGATGTSYTVENTTEAMNGHVYKVKVTHRTTHCYGYGQGTLTVYPNPTVTLSQEVICINNVSTSTITVVAAGGSGMGYKYYWTVPEGAITPGMTEASITTTIPGRYTVRVVDSRHCEVSGHIDYEAIPCRRDGCTPGFWKNIRPAAGFPVMASGCGVLFNNRTASGTFNAAFGMSEAHNIIKNQSTLSLAAALDLGGGGSTNGYTQLARAATAAYFNICAADVHYQPTFTNGDPLTIDNLSLRMQAIFSNSSSTAAALALAAELDRYNNAGCSINNAGRPITPAAASKASEFNVEGSFGSKVEAYPNPFSDKVSLSFSVKENGRAQVHVYDLMGRLVGTAFDGNVEAGIETTATFDARSLSNGVYIYRLTNNGIVVGNGRMLHQK